MIELEEQLKEANKEIDELNKEIDELNKENDDLSDKLIKKDRQITKLNKDLNNLLEDNEEMNKDIDEFEKENIELKKNIKKLKKELGREIENNNNVNKEADDLFEKNIKISESYQKLQKKYEELFNNNKDKEAKIISLEKDLNQCEFMDFDTLSNEKINNININGNGKLMIKNLKAKNEELEQQILELQNELKEQDEDLTDLNNELKNKEEKLEEYNIILNEEKGKNYELQKKLKELIEKLSIIDDINIQNQNLNEKLNGNGNNQEINSEQFIPDNFNILKCIHLSINNNHFRWYILKKIKSELIKENSGKKSKIKNTKNNINEEEDGYNNISYEDFIFIPEKNKDKLNKFKLPLGDSFEKEKIITDLESNLKTLEKRLKKKEKDFNVLNINFTNLLHQNKTSNKNQEKLKNTIETLKEENQNLNKNLMKYNNNRNFLGISFIEEDENDNQFLEDKCFEDILNELDGKSRIIGHKNNYRNDPYIKQNNIYNRNENMFYSSANKFYPQNFRTLDNTSENNDIMKDDNNLIKNIKESFRLLINQIDPSQNAKLTIASILKLLGYKEKEIIKIIGNNPRGVISIPNSNKNKYKK